MSYLLDTCVVSEPWKPSPSRAVLAWLGDTLEEELLVSVLTLGEIQKGIARLVEGRKKERLTHDYALLRSRFSGRVLPVNAAVAERWGELSASAARAGRALHVVDGLLAATALVHGHTLVTRNVDDFASTPVPVLDPWE
jgi:predicted nucleic acid-binding protein